ncbi:MAG: 16S rRNA (cytidine(1402)-2'-O)-methyltransferase [Pseudomonadota bacterium]
MSVEKSCLYIVATPIGNLGDVTARAAEILKDVDEIWAEDTRHSRKLMQHLRINTKLVACHDHNEAERAKQLLTKLAAGFSIALISDAGTPLISDPGYRIVCAARENGFNVYPIPGASAVIAALCASGMPTDRFSFEGFLPAKTRARSQALAELASESRTLVFYESSHRIAASISAMRDVFGADRQACVARELTKLHESIQTGRLGELCEKIDGGEIPAKGEFAVVVRGANPSAENESSRELARLLPLLLAELSPKRAAKLAAEITGVSRNEAYQAAIELKQPK